MLSLWFIASRIMGGNLDSSSETFQIFLSYDRKGGTGCSEIINNQIDLKHIVIEGQCYFSRVLCHHSVQNSPLPHNKCALK